MTAVENDGETLRLKLSNPQPTDLLSIYDDAVGTIRNTKAEVEGDPLTASFSDVRRSHDGESASDFVLEFSVEPQVSYGTLRDTACDVDGGDVVGPSRRTDGAAATCPGTSRSSRTATTRSRSRCPRPPTAATTPAAGPPRAGRSCRTGRRPPWRARRWSRRSCRWSPLPTPPPRTAMASALS